jgi:hypothetical protein
MVTGYWVFTLFNSIAFIASKALKLVHDAELILNTMQIISKGTGTRAEIQTPDLQNMKHETLPTQPYGRPHSESLLLDGTGPSTRRQFQKYFV